MPPFLTRRRRGGTSAALAVCGFAAVATVAAAASASGESCVDARADRRAPLRLRVDEYHHFPRAADYSQGFSLDVDDFDRTCFYSIDGTAHPNGLFMFSQAISRDFRAEVSVDPIGPDLARRADAYMLVCPETAAAGNPHPVTPADAENLERFVAGGGILILVHNSVSDPNTDSLDLRGMNRIARRFGLEFLAKATRTVSIPIARDHPVFFGVRDIIFGNGTTIGIHPRPEATATVLLESTNPAVPGAVAVRVRFGRGTVLALGDAGTLGNGNMARRDVGQSAAVAQLFHCLLPTGPLPAYGWEEGMAIKARVHHEVALSGYPEAMRCLELPFDPAAGVLVRRPRQLDLQAAPTSRALDVPGPASTTAPDRNRFLMARAAWDLEARLEIGKHDGRAFSVRWTGPDGAVLACRLTARGEALDPSAKPSTLDPWRWALLSGVLVGPLDAQAQPGDEWECPVMVPLPSIQLHPASVTRAATGRFRFEGRRVHAGRPCFVLTATAVLPLNEVAPQDLVGPEYAASFDPTNTQVRDGEQVCKWTTWVDERTRLPTRTVFRASAALWWTDRRTPDRLISDHTYTVMEERTERRRVLVVGRVLQADFEPRAPGQSAGPKPLGIMR
jgi:hypothetical protein